MANWKQENTIITNIGLSMLSKAQVGLGKLSITKVVTREATHTLEENRLLTGDSIHPSDSIPYKQSAVLLNPVGEGDAETLDGQNVGVSKITARFSNDNLSAEYKIKQVIVYAQLIDLDVNAPAGTDMGEVPYMVAQTLGTSDYDKMPLFSENPTAINYDLYILHSGVSTIDISVTPAGYVDVDSYNTDIQLITTNLNNVKNNLVGQNTNGMQFDVWTPVYTEDTDLSGGRTWSKSETTTSVAGTKSAERFNMYSANDNIAIGDCCHVEGASNIALTSSTHVEGSENYVGEGSWSTHAEGIHNKAITGWYQHIEGDSNQSSGYACHTEGVKNKVASSSTHTEGSWNTSIAGSDIHLEGGHNTNTNGSVNHLQGYANTNQSGDNNHIGGNNNVVTTSNSTIISGAENTITDSNNCSVSGNKNTVTSSLCATATGADNIISNSFKSLVTGSQNEISGVNSYANFVAGSQNKNTLGSKNTILSGLLNEVTNGSAENIVAGQSSVLSHVGQSIVAGSSNTLTNSFNSILLGGNNIVAKTYYSDISGHNNSIEPYDFVTNNVEGPLNVLCNVITGEHNSIKGLYSSILSGCDNVIENIHDSIIAGKSNSITSRVWGLGTNCVLCTGDDCTIESDGTPMVATGTQCVVKGSNAVAQNKGTKASGNEQTTIGRFNVEDTLDKYAFIVGGGTSDLTRKDIIEVDWNGNLLAGGIYSNGEVPTPNDKGSGVSLGHSDTDAMHRLFAWTGSAFSKLGIGASVNSKISAEFNTDGTVTFNFNISAPNIPVTKTLSVPTSAWVADTTYSGYGYRATVADANVTTSKDVDVAFDMASIPTILNATIAPATAIYNGGFYLYSASIPSQAVTGTYTIKVVV